MSKCFNAILWVAFFVSSSTFAFHARTIKQVRTSEMADGTIVHWTRVQNHELSNLGVNDLRAFGEAWKESQTGVIWGDIARDVNDKIVTLTQEEAKKYCQKIGAILPSGWHEPENVAHENEDSDFVRLSKYIGARSDQGDGYWPYVGDNMNETVLPHLIFKERHKTYSYNFWSSSGYPPIRGYGYAFSGSSGYLHYSDGDTHDHISLRCLVRSVER